MYAWDMRSGARIKNSRAVRDHNGIITDRAEADKLDADAYPSYKPKNEGRVPYSRPEQEDRFLATTYRPYQQKALSRAAATLTRLAGKVFSITATGTSSLVLQALKALSYTATGTSTLARAVSLAAKSITATGTSTLTTAVTYLYSAATVTATGTASLATSLVYLFSSSFTATGTSTLTRQAQPSRSFTATGTSSLTNQIGFNLSYTATGTSTLATQLTAAGVLSHAIQEALDSSYVSRFPNNKNYALLQILK